MKTILDYYGKEITEEEAKGNALAEYKYDNPEEALVDLIINQGSVRFHWETASKIGKITKQINYKGVKLDSYLEWKDNVFLTMMGVWIFVSKTKEI